MAKKKTRDTAVQTAEQASVKYTHRLLYQGPISNLDSAYSQYSFTDQGSLTEMRAVMITAEDRASFIVMRKCKGRGRKTGKEWTSWQDVVQVFISTKPSKKTGKRSLNVYGKFRRNQTGDKKWSPLHNITGDHFLIRHLVAGDFIKDFNKEVFRLVSNMNSGNPLPLPDSKVLEELRDKSSIEARNRFYSKYNSEVERQARYVSLNAYPMLRTREIDGHGQLFGARCATDIEYAKMLFGVTNYRKDLVKAVAKSGYVPNIMFARAFRNLVPIDWIVKFLKETESDKLPVLDYVVLRKVVKVLSLKHRRRLLNDIIAYATQPSHHPERRRVRNSYIVVDAIRSAEKLPAAMLAELTFSGWQEFHDVAYMKAVEIQKGNHEIPLNKMAEKIAALEVTKDIRIILPKDTSTLRKWGQDMHHCIGSYADNALSGQHVFIGILKDGEMIGNAQFDTRRRVCNQIFGKHNRRLDTSDLETVRSLMVKNNILPEDAFDLANGYRNYGGY